MKRPRKRKRDGIERRTPPGAAPGTIAVDPEAPRSYIRALAYGPEGAVEQEVTDPGQLAGVIAKLREAWPVVWVNVDGLGDAATIQAFGEIFGLHRLSLEDVVNVHQRAKAELYDEYYFIVARMAETGERFGTEQLSIFLGKNYVLTFQERRGDCFDPVRERIRKSGGQIRKYGPDYLAYALLDAFVDNYFPVLERYGERLENLEDEVIVNPDRAIVGQIHEVKRDLLVLRRAVWPLREAINSLIRESTAFISQETRLYLRDCYDHAIQIIDLLENYRDIASSLMEVYLSSVSNRLNETMKVLTIFTTLFIPLTFISSIYGMNFKHMPELEWPYGYLFAWAIMAAAAGGMLYYFRKKGWMGSRH
jgi:magnesium transporter